jgi:anti-sigma factor RsiW
VLQGEREVGGLRCSQVLDVLSLFVDRELPDRVEVQVRAHVAGCDVCARFGAEFSAMVEALRQGREPDAPSPGVVSRLQARLGREVR